MIVQRVVMPVTEAESWTVLGDDGDPVAPIEAYLNGLAVRQPARSPGPDRGLEDRLQQQPAFSWGPGGRPPA